MTLISPCSSRVGSGKAVYGPATSVSMHSVSMFVIGTYSRPWTIKAHDDSCIRKTPVQFDRIAAIKYQ
ncbi:hypothetical protein DPMN_048811 [Dreissena polymorpha]|uniref:Uncharacterized protein n=1 Tax=Dreissena polymorpha TaxID=45954 RepID=A0A9D4DC83_DREPO|nr:hypothetical protein DPMN_048811 [Dreissena polymorpha]